MPVDVSEYLAENSADENRQQTEKAEEASFATSTTWTEEEARFTPIDIEAAEVAEASAEEVSAVETGFAFSSLPDEPPANSETPAASAAQEQASESPATDLSAAAIEAIVRRVVAEMSESVVREVAWEVVPDCVERVIEQLTRESLSKRA
jgi:histone H3/H4